MSQGRKVVLGAWYWAKFSFVELRYYQCVEKDNGNGLDQQLLKAKGELKPCPDGQPLTHTPKQVNHLPR